MDIIFVKDGNLTELQRMGVDYINKTCLSSGTGDAAIERDMYDWGAPEDGMFLLVDDDKIAGQVSVHRTPSDYDRQIYMLGGFGGLAVLPEYRGRGLGRRLAEEALYRAREIGIDVACMSVNMESGITELYKRLGFRYLGRPARFIGWDNKIKTEENVMIMGVNNKPLAQKILSTDMVFHYGNCKGHW